MLHANKDRKAYAAMMSSMDEGIGLSFLDYIQGIHYPDCPTLFHAFPQIKKLWLYDILIKMREKPITNKSLKQH